MKKVSCLILSILFLFTLAGGLFSCRAKEKTLVLFIGDSIAEAVAGPTPVTERESYGYYGIIGNINDYEYYNRGVSGATALTLYRHLTEEDDGINMMQSLLSTADVIHLSILGNNLLNTDRTKLLLEVASGDESSVLKIKKNAREYFDKSIAVIRAANPKATLLVQTLYNPANEVNPLISTRARNGLSALGKSPEDYHDIMGQMVRRINEVFYEYIEEHSANGVAPYELVDVYGAIEEVYSTDKARYDTLFCEDGIHPYNEAHAIIAECIQDKLVSLGLAGENTLSRYKDIRTRQLARVYGDTADVPAVTAAIEAATTMRGVTTAYFDGTKDLTPTAALTLNYAGEHFSEDKTYKVTLLDLMGYEATAFIDAERSYISFRTDGTYDMMLYPETFALFGVRSFIANAAPMNLTRDYRLYLADPYLYNVAPGADLRDIPDMLAACERAYGISVQGLLYDSESGRKILSTFRETGELVIEDYGFFDMDTLAIRWQGQYRLQEMTSRLTGATFTAIYINAGIDESEPFFRYTYTEYDDGSSRVRLTVSVTETELEGESVD